MAQKKKVSVSSVASKKAKEVQKTAAARTKTTATKKAATKPQAKTKATATKTIAKAPAKKPAAKKTAATTTAAKAPAKKRAATSASKAPAKKAVQRAAAKPAAKKIATKATTAPKSKAATKSSGSMRAKIAAAAKKVAAQKTARAPSKAAPARVTKAVAAAGPSTAKRSSEPVASAPAAEPKKPAAIKHDFKLHEYVVYPAHGVGQIIAIEEQEIAGMSLELFVITFEKDKMTLRVPTSKVDSMRKLAEDNIVDKAMSTLKGRARVKRTMWSRRAQEYENKINSGDLIAISEVVRDLYRSESQPEQSYSERQLYEAALDRMARELAAVAEIDERQATQRIVEVLSKSAKGRRLAEEEKAASEAAKNGDAEAA
jgi:CarD family transcriptional regulator